jgi:dTDP-glucose 4,6-dehydratase
MRRIVGIVIRITHDQMQVGSSAAIPNRANAARVRFGSDDDNGIQTFGFHVAGNFIHFGFRVCRGFFKDAHGVYRHSEHNQNFLVVEILADKVNTELGKLIGRTDRLRNPNLFCDAEMIDASRLDRALRQLAAEYDDGIRGRERIFDNEPAADAEKSQRGQHEQEREHSERDPAIPAELRPRTAHGRRGGLGIRRVKRRHIEAHIEEARRRMLARLRGPVNRGAQGLAPAEHEIGRGLPRIPRRLHTRVNRYFGKKERIVRAVITGGAGFLGSHLCDYLLAQGWEVVAIDNLVTGTAANLKHLEGHARFSTVQHDVSRHITIAGPIDYVLHFASPASPVDYLKLPIQTLKVGALGTHNTLGLAMAKKAKYFLASTSECYGDPAVSPQPETYWGNVNPIGPRGVYDEAKRFAEAIVMAYHRYHGVDTHIVRIFNTYGPRMRLNDGRALPNFVYQALTGQPITVYGDGSQTRSFCYVSDLVEGIFRLMQSDEHEPTNIGNPQEITILEFAERIRALTETGTPIVFKPLPQDDPKQRCPDISKARRLLHWEPKVNLEEGLRRTLEYFKQQVAATKLS